MNKQKKIKHVAITILSLFVFEVLAVTYFSKDITGRYESKKVSIFKDTSSLTPSYNKNTSSRAKVVNTNKGSFLNVRSGSGTQYRVVGQLKHNARQITVLYCVKGWCKITYNNVSIGWVSARYLRKEGSVSKKKNLGNNNCDKKSVIHGIDRKGDGFVAIRSGAGSKYRMIDKIYSNGTTVFICKKHKKWKNILYGKHCDGVVLPSRGLTNCKQGWVFGRYVR